MKKRTMQHAAFDSVTLEYEVQGSGEPVVLIHLAPYADSFLPLMDQPALAGYKLVRYRRRGYGGSSRTPGRITIPDQAADLAGLLKYLGITRAHAAGHSYGGTIALQLALAHPNLVGSLVLMEPALRVASLRGRTGGSACEDLTRRMAPGFQRYREGDLEGAVDTFFLATFPPDYRRLLDQVLPGGWWAQTVRDAPTFFGIEHPELQHWQFGAVEAERITAPVLLALGALSHPCFAEIAQLLDGWLPHMDTARVPQVGHMLHLQRADLVAAAVAEFLARYPLSTAARKTAP